MESYIEKGNEKGSIGVLSAMFNWQYCCFGGEYCLQQILPSLSRTFNITPIETSLAMSFWNCRYGITMIVVAVAF